MKINQIIVNETTSGSIAPVSQPLGSTQTRNSSVYGDNKVGTLLKGKKIKAPFANSIAEGKKVDEAKLDEDDKIIAPGKGSRLKPGLHGKDKKVTALSQFRVPFRAEGLWVSDGRGRPVLEVTEHGTLATEVALALNSFVSKNESVAQEGTKVDRMVKHIAKSERGLGHSKKEAENIAWATANKRGMLNNKNKK